ncbi:MAG: aminotransferase class V-fold PLP-dependent enzyme [Bacteroidota bacterium]
MTSRKDFIKQVGLGAALSPLLALEPVTRTFNQQLEHVDFSKLPNKRDYGFGDEVTYLNHASIGAIPNAVHKAHVELLTLCEQNPWLYMWGGDWEEPREQVRQKAADFIGAPSSEITISHNTTEVYNVLAMGLPLGPGDEVLFSNLNHAGASIPFEYHSKRKGYTVREFNIPTDDVPSLTKSEIIQLHVDQITPATKLLVLPHIDNSVGIRQPVKEIVKAAREKGVEYISLDAAQTVGMIPFSVNDLDVDVIATSTHKWIQSPKGVSITYVRENMWEILEPMWVTWGQNRWGVSARRYEDYGTRNFPEVITLGHALDFQMKLDENLKQNKLKTLWSLCQELSEEHPKTIWRSSRDWELGGSLFAIEIKEEKASDFAQRMFKDHGIVFRPFNNLNSVRISPNYMTSEDEVRRFFELI